MTQHQYTKHDSVRLYPRPERQENPGAGSKTDPGPERGEEASLRIETIGYGGATLGAVVPAETLSEIEMGDRPVEASLEIGVPGYGRRVVGVRVPTRDEEGAPGKARSVRMRVPGYGSAPFKLADQGVLATTPRGACPISGAPIPYERRTNSGIGGDDVPVMITAGNGTNYDTHDEGPPLMLANGVGFGRRGASEQIPASFTPLPHHRRARDARDERAALCPPDRRETRSGGHRRW